MYYRLQSNDSEPLLIAQKVDNEVALMISYTPSFEEETKSTESTKIETVFDEKPEAKELPREFEEERKMFIFIVDRSGSMQGDKMDTTK